MTPERERTACKPQCYPSTEYRKGTILMNTNSNRRPVSIAIALTAAASVITLITAGSATASIASEPRGTVTSGTSNSASVDGSFGVPLAALGGQSLAEYLADHWAPVIVAGV